jgi:hypothetical protein
MSLVYIVMLVYSPFSPHAVDEEHNRYAIQALKILIFDGKFVFSPCSNGFDDFQTNASHKGGYPLFKKVDDKFQIIGCFRIVE